MICTAWPKARGCGSTGCTSKYLAMQPTVCPPRVGHLRGCPATPIPLLGGHYVGQVRALVKTQPGAGLELQEVPEPQTGPGEVKIRVLRAGLCGTDLHLQQWDDW